MSKYKLGYTSAEAAFVAMGLLGDPTILHLNRSVLNPHGFTILGEDKDKDKNELEEQKKQYDAAAFKEAYDIYCALLIEVENTCASNSFRDDSSYSGVSPSVLKLYIKNTWRPEDEMIHSEKLEISKQSLAAWFHSMNEPSKAKLFEPVEPGIADIGQHQKVQEVFATEDIPKLLKLAYQIYKDVWCDIPKGMRNPTKEQLKDHMKEAFKSITNVDIDAMIRLSLPDKISFGGHGDKSKKKWMPKEKR
jgi:hypothetical protein